MKAAEQKSSPQSSFWEECLCDSGLVHVVMHCTSLHILHTFSSQMLEDEGDGSARLLPATSRK